MRVSAASLGVILRLLGVRGPAPRRDGRARPRPQPRSSTSRSAESSWSRRAASSARRARRDVDVVRFLVAHRDHSLGRAGCSPRPPSYRARSSAEDSPLTSSAAASSGRGSRRSGHRPFAASDRKLGWSCANEHDRDAGGDRSAIPSRRLRKVSSPHWTSSKTAHEPALLLQQLPESPGDLFGARLVSPASRQGANRRRRATESDGKVASCLITSTLAGGPRRRIGGSGRGPSRASSPAERPVTRRDLPMPGSPTTVSDSQRCSAGATPGFTDQLDLPCAPDEAGLVRGLGCGAAMAASRYAGTG